MVGGVKVREASTVGRLQTKYLFYSGCVKHTYGLLLMRVGTVASCNTSYFCRIEFAFLTFLWPGNHFIATHEISRLEALALLVSFYLTFDISERNAFKPSLQLKLTLFGVKYGPLKRWYPITTRHNTEDFYVELHCEGLKSRCKRCMLQWGYRNRRRYSLIKSSMLFVYVPSSRLCRSEFLHFCSIGLLLSAYLDRLHALYP
jgi:hypothetical protein